MRPLLLLAPALLLLACSHPAQSAPPPTAPPAQTAESRAVQKPALSRGEPCTEDAQCGPGLVCEGCSDADRKCISGCRNSEDCAQGEQCREVQCIRCPCPRLCGR